MGESKVGQSMGQPIEREARLATDLGGQKAEAREGEIQEKSIYLGSLLFVAKIICGGDGSITFTEEIYLEKQASTLMSRDGIGPLIQAGILDQETSWYRPGESGFQLAEDGYDGWVHIKKEDINSALRDGRLKATLEEDGIVSIDN